MSLYDSFEKIRIPFSWIAYVVFIVNLVMYHNCLLFFISMALLIGLNQVYYCTDWYYSTCCKSTRNFGWFIIAYCITMFITYL